MTTSNYRPTVAETLYREHKAIMDAAAEQAKVIAGPCGPVTSNRAERRRQEAKARKARP